MEKRQIRKSKLWMFIFSGLFVVSIAVSVWLATIMPRERTFKAESGNIIDVVSDGSGEWLYATSNGALVKMSDNDTVENTYNIATMIKEKYNLEAGVLRKFYKEKESDYLWLFTSHLDEGGNSNSYLFQAQVEDDQVTLVDYTFFEGNLDNIRILEQNSFLYVITSGKQVAELFKFNVADIKAGVVQNTYLYDCTKENNGVKLTAVRMPEGINLFEADEEYLYILYNAGLIRVSTDFADVKYNSKSSSYKVESLDTSKYISFGISGVSSSGGAFVKDSGKFYITSRNSDLYSFNATEIDDLEVGDDLSCQVVSGINFEPIPKKDSAIYYEEQSGVAYVLHDSSSKATQIDLKAEKQEFTFDLEINIEKIVKGRTETDVFYIYKNVNKTGEAEKAILSYVNVEARRNEVFITVGFYATMTLVLISAVVTIVLAVIVHKKKEEYAKKVLKQMRKQWKIYLMLLPALILLILFCYYEAIASIALSFFDYSVDNPTMIWNNFENYKEVFFSADSAEAFLNMVIFLVFDLVTAIVPPLIFAFFLSVMKSERLSNGVRTLLFVANVVPTIAGMLIWKTGIYGGNGVLNSVIKLFGGEPIAFLGQTEYAKWAILMIGFPFVGAYLIFYGGIMNIPKSYYEVAELEGIGIWKRFFSIDIPLIFPQLKYVFITSFIASLQNFQRTYMVTGGSFGTKTPIHLMYQNMVNGEYGQASAYATVIFILLFGATYANLRKQKQDLGD